MTPRAWLSLTLLTLTGLAEARVLDQPLFVRPPQIQAPELAPAVRPSTPRSAAPAGAVKPLPVTLPATRATPAASGVSVNPVQVSPVKPSAVNPGAVKTNPVKAPGVRVQGGGLGLRASGAGAPSSTVLHPSLGFKPLSIVFRRSP